MANSVVGARLNHITEASHTACSTLSMTQTIPVFPNRSKQITIQGRQAINSHVISYFFALAWRITRGPLNNATFVLFLLLPAYVGSLSFLL